MPDDPKVKIVDQYSILIRERGGFQFIILQLLAADQTITSYEFHPAFAYALSDELLKASALAAPKVSSRE
jgi:hypothetical protein